MQLSNKSKLKNRNHWLLIYDSYSRNSCVRNIVNFCQYFLSVITFCVNTFYSILSVPWNSKCAFLGTHSLFPLPLTKVNLDNSTELFGKMLDWKQDPEDDFIHCLTGLRLFLRCSCSEYLYLLIKIKLYMRSKCLNKLLLQLRKALNIFTLYHQFFSFMNDFDHSGGRVIKYVASRQREFNNQG